MNGYNLLARAAALIGIEKIGDTLKITGLSIVNAALEEVGLPTLSSLSENIGVLAEKQTTALVFGTATLIALSLGDGEAASAVSQLYAKKLAALKGRCEMVCDRLPKGDWS